MGNATPCDVIGPAAGPHPSFRLGSDQAAIELRNEIGLAEARQAERRTHYMQAWFHLAHWPATDREIMPVPFLEDGRPRGRVFDVKNLSAEPRESSGEVILARPHMIPCWRQQPDELAALQQPASGLEFIGDRKLLARRRRHRFQQ